MATYSGKKNNLKKLGTPIKKFHNCKTEKKTDLSSEEPVAEGSCNTTHLLMLKCNCRIQTTVTAFTREIHVTMGQAG